MVLLRVCLLLTYLGRRQEGGYREQDRQQDFIRECNRSLLSGGAEPLVAAPREGATISASLGRSARRGLRDATPENERTDLAGSCAAQANPLVRRGAYRVRAGHRKVAEVIAGRRVGDE